MSKRLIPVCVIGNNIVRFVKEIECVAVVVPDVLFLIPVERVSCICAIACVKGECCEGCYRSILKLIFFSALVFEAPVFE